MGMREDLFRHPPTSRTRAKAASSTSRRTGEFFPRRPENCNWRLLRHWLTTALAAWALCVAPHAAAQDTAEPDAKTIVAKADQVRFPDAGFEVVVDIDSKLSGGNTESRKYKVLSKGNENTVVMVLEPASERGQIMLMKGRDLWIFLPNVSQPVRLGLAQRLTGQVANGDLARANFAGDYNATLQGIEDIDGAPYYKLALDAVDRGVTYGKVMYWVRKADYRPLKAQFYSLSGRLLKTAHYRGYEQMAGRVRPTELLMEDALRHGEQSVLRYNSMKLRELPDKIFTKDYLKRLE